MGPHYLPKLFPPSISPTTTSIMWILSLLTTACLVFSVHCSIGTIPCSGSAKGTTKTFQKFECDREGGAKCGEYVEDCSGCGIEGTFTGGVNNYENGRFRSAIGPGWDCTKECEGNPGSSGKKTRTTSISC